MTLKFWGAKMSVTGQKNKKQQIFGTKHLWPTLGIRLLTQKIIAYYDGSTNSSL